MVKLIRYGAPTGMFQFVFEMVPMSFLPALWHHAHPHPEDTGNGHWTCSAGAKEQKFCGAREFSAAEVHPFWSKEPESL